MTVVADFNKKSVSFKSPGLSTTPQSQRLWGQKPSHQTPQPLPHSSLVGLWVSQHRLSISQHLIQGLQQYTVSSTVTQPTRRCCATRGP